MICLEGFRGLSFHCMKMKNDVSSLFFMWANYIGCDHLTLLLDVCDQVMCFTLSQFWLHCVWNVETLPKKEKEGKVCP